MEDSIWLQIDDDNFIVGVHSDECETGDRWVQTNDLDAMPGDNWVDGKLKKNRPEHDSISEDEALENSRRLVASKEIRSKYPEWKQINIIRSGDQNEIRRMGEFIDSVRDWSNKLSLPEKSISKIISKHFPK